MRESNIYRGLWQKYKPAIISKMRMALAEPQEYQLSKHEFEAIGERSSSGYAFNLELNNGILVNNIDGTAVARDLLEVLKSSNAAKELMHNHYYKIIVNSNFKLKIQIII